MIPVIPRVTTVEAMMGRRSGQSSLFYQFKLDERVPKDHLLRRLSLMGSIFTMAAFIALAH